MQVLAYLDLVSGIAFSCEVWCWHLTSDLYWSNQVDRLYQFSCTVSSRYFIIGSAYDRCTQWTLIYTLDSALGVRNTNGNSVFPAYDFMFSAYSNRWTDNIFQRHQCCCNVNHSPLLIRTNVWITLYDSFNRTLMNKKCIAMGQEFRGKGIHVQLGPMMSVLSTLFIHMLTSWESVRNLMRIPASGRAWEGYVNICLAMRDIWVTKVVGTDSAEILTYQVKAHTRRSLVYSPRAYKPLRSTW